MGLDTVELVMEVEDAFGIKIPNDRAEKIQTAGDLYEFVLESRPDLGSLPQEPENADVCISALTFYALRRSLAAHGMIDTRIRPQDGVHETLSARDRRNVWQSIGKELGVRMPPLRRPKWVVGINLVVITFLVFFVFYEMAKVSNFESGLGSALFTLVVMSILVFHLTKPLAVIPGTVSDTYRSLMGAMMRLNKWKLYERYGVETESVVWDQLRYILADQSGVDENKITRDTHIIYDLNVG